jgi:carboxyl-terminal processing protease
MVDRRNRNTVSLNKELRKKELNEAEERRKLRNIERNKRFGKLAESDMKIYRFYRLDLEDVKRETLVEIDRDKINSSYMRKAKDDLKDLDDTPEWPSGLDPVKRESIQILADLVEATKRADIAGAVQNNNG